MKSENKIKRDRIIESVLLWIALLLVGWVCGLHAGCTLQ